MVAEQAKAKNAYQSLRFSRTSLDVPEFDVPGPWDDREPLIWIRCSRCGCTSRYEEGDSECTEILTKGYGIKKTQRFCYCVCHHGNAVSLPILKVKREVG